jgi:NAD(P)-dependent dehydrogenase (short-subunit alcohol dehydrogenase family)
MKVFNLAGQVAIVTGASRGVGRGIALGLGEAGATVYVTGRTIDRAATIGLGGTIGETAGEVTSAGGKGIAIACDHRDDREVDDLFRHVIACESRLDILVNSVWGGYEDMLENNEFTWHRPFWTQPVSRWDDMFDAGVRACYVAGRLAARKMVEQRSGLIVNVSSFAGRSYANNVAYGVAKAATDRLAADMAVELKAHNVAAVSLYPGMVRTERVMKAAEFLDLSNSESPQFIGRAVAALAADPDLLEKTGQALVAADLAVEYGFTDVDGRLPRPLAL